MKNKKVTFGISFVLIILEAAILCASAIAVGNPGWLVLVHFGVAVFALITLYPAMLWIQGEEDVRIGRTDYPLGLTYCALMQTVLLILIIISIIVHPNVGAVRIAHYALVLLTAFNIFLCNTQNRHSMAEIAERITAEKNMQTPDLPFDKE